VGMMLEGGISKAAHVPVHIGSTHVGLLSSSINLKNIRVYNPKGFPERRMLDAPQLFIHFDLPAFFKSKVHFKQVRINLKELIVIKNRDGRLNVDAAKPTETERNKKEKAKPGKAPEFQIDELHLTIGRVVYKDYSAGPPPQVQTFEIGIQDRVFTNINDPTAVVSLVMFEALTRTTLSRLVNLDISVFKEGASDVLSKSLGLVGDGTGTIQDTAKNILKLFD